MMRKSVTDLPSACACVRVPSDACRTPWLGIERVGSLICRHVPAWWCALPVPMSRFPEDDRPPQRRFEEEERPPQRPRDDERRYDERPPQRRFEEDDRWRDRDDRRDR